MKINKNQQNINFQQNVLVRFPEKPQGNIREIAKRFAVEQGKIDSAQNTGLALFVDSLSILVLDKTVEISKKLKDYYYTFMHRCQRIKVLEYNGEFAKLDPNKANEYLRDRNLVGERFHALLYQVADELEPTPYKY